MPGAVLHSRNGTAVVLLGHLAGYPVVLTRNVPNRSYAAVFDTAMPCQFRKEYTCRIRK